MARICNRCGCEDVSGEKGQPNAPSLSLGLEESEDVVNSDRALDVSDDRSRGVVHELDSDLGDTTTGSSSAEDLFDQRMPSCRGPPAATRDLRSICQRPPRLHPAPCPTPIVSERDSHNVVDRMCSTLHPATGRIGAAQTLRKGSQPFLVPQKHLPRPRSSFLGFVHSVSSACPIERSISHKTPASCSSPSSSRSRKNRL